MNLSGLSERAQAMIDEAREAKAAAVPASLAKQSQASSTELPGDLLLKELSLTGELGEEPPVVTVVTADGQRIPVLPAKQAPALHYSPIGLVEFLIANPGLSLKDIAKAYGRTASWLSSIVASDNFQKVLDPRRSEVSDPFFTATMEERFRALALRSGHILLEKLDQKEVSDHVILKATELSIKALGMGMTPPAQETIPEVKLTVAEKMAQAMELMDKRRDAVALEMEIAPQTEEKDE